MNIRKLVILCVATCALLSVAVSAKAQSTPRIVTQKLVCDPPYDILNIVTNTTGSSPDYQIEADILETPGETLSWSPGSDPNPQLYIRKQGDNVVVAVQLSQFTTQWEAGQTLRVTITHIDSGQYAYHDITIPTGIEPLMILDPVMVIPPFFQLEAPAGLTAHLNDGDITLSWLPVVGADSYMIYMCGSEDPNDVYYAFLGYTASTQYYYMPPVLPYDTQRHYFFRVTAQSGRVESEPSDVIWLALDYISQPGYNLIGVPCVPHEMWVSEFISWMNLEDQVSDISYWDAQDQIWNTAYDFGGWWEEFEVNAGMVLLPYLYSGDHYLLFSKIYSDDSDYPISIYPGYNMIFSSPQLQIPDLDLDGEISIDEMAADIGAGVESISCWDPILCSWKQHNIGHNLNWQWGPVLPWQRLCVYSTVALPNWRTP